jgi:peptidoglycan hydrolase CwlO-like protein
MRVMSDTHKLPLTRMRGPRSTRLVAALAATLVLLALPGVSAQAGSSQTKNELNTALKKLHRLEGQIAAQQKVLDGLRAEATVLAGKIDHVQSRIARTQFLIIKKETEIQDAQDALTAAQKQLDHRAWVAYENGPGSSLDFLLGSTSLADLSTRLEIVNRVAQTDQDLIIQIQALQNRLLDRKAELVVLENDLRDRKAELVSQHRALQAKIDTAQAIEDKLAANRARAASLVQSLQDKYRKQLEAERLAALRAGGGSGESIGGVFFVCPVSGFAVYSDDFGAPRYAGGFHPHAGNDIFAKRGTPIVAPFPGNAVMASNGLGGLSVKVFGAAGYVYNAHLDGFGKLGSVGTGEVVGYVGDSGDARGGATHDHFEWHPNVIPSNPHRSPYGYTVIGSAVDPYPYLNSVCP